MKKNKSLEIKRISEDLKKNPNMNFKNYPELCKYLKISQEKGGKQKNNQLKELSKTIKFVKNEDFSYTICGIIDENSLNIMTYDNKDLKGLTKYAILSYILYAHKKEKDSGVLKISEESNRISAPIGNLATLIGYVTNKYFYYKKHPKELSYATSIPIDTIYEVLDKIGDLYYRYVDESLKSLEKYKFIALEKIYYGKEIKPDFKVRKDKNIYGDIVTSEYIDINFDDKRRLTDEEIIKYQQLEKDTFFEIIKTSKKFNKDYCKFDLISENGKNSFLSYLEDNKRSMIGLLFSYNKAKVYYEKLEKRVYKDLHLSSAYCAFDIIYDIKNIEDALNYSLSNFFDTKKIITQNASLKILTNSYRRHKREKKKYEDIDDKDFYMSVIDLETSDIQQLLPILMYEDISLLSDNDFTSELKKIRKSHENMIKSLSLQEYNEDSKISSNIDIKE